MSICIRDDKIELNLCYLTSTSKSTPIRFEIHCAEEGIPLASWKLQTLHLHFLLPMPAASIRSQEPALPLPAL